MSRLAATLRAAAEHLKAIDKPWALIGGLAVSVRAEPRLTRDVDIVVAIGSDPEAEALIFALQQKGYVLRTLLEQTSVGRLATARLRSSASEQDQNTVMLDLLFASSGIEAEIAAAADSLEVLPGLVVPVATRAHLIALKLLARNDRTRPQDADDIRALLRSATPEELADVQPAIDLIAERGFHRGRDLRTELDEFRP